MFERNRYDLYVYSSGFPRSGVESQKKTKKKTVRRKARKVGIDVEWALVFKSASRKAGILWKG